MLSWLGLWLLMCNDASLCDELIASCAPKQIPQHFELANLLFIDMNWHFLGHNDFWPQENFRLQ